LRPFRTGWRQGGRKAEAYVAADYLDDALAEFSGYIAADELYDGPFCVLSIVDNRVFKRLAYEVLDHDPQHEDLRRFFRRFRAALAARDLNVEGITTDASPLYPVPLAEVFGPVPHQICEFHILAELTKAVLKAVTQVRKALLCSVMSRAMLKRGTGLGRLCSPQGGIRQRARFFWEKDIGADRRSRASCYSIWTEGFPRPDQFIETPVADHTEGRVLLPRAERSGHLRGSRRVLQSALLLSL
jgi:hypothetical protein